MGYRRGSQSVLLATAVVLVAAMALNSPLHGGSSAVKKSSIKVLSPTSLQQTRDASIFNFSMSDSGFHGGVTVGSLAYPFTVNTKGCKPFDGDKDFKSTSSSLPTILLLDRGECYFALKVWNGQQAGAAAVLVVDDVEEPLISTAFPVKTSYDIGIPSALIERSFGDVLKHALRGGDDVLIEVDWESVTQHVQGERII